MEVEELVLFGYMAYKKLKTLKEKKRTEKQRERRYWVHEMFLSRDSTGFFVTVYPKIKDDDEKFFKYTRMNQSTFHLLLNLLKERLEKFSIRKPLCPEFRLLLTIMYLAHGGPRLIYSSQFQIGLTTFRKIVYETCSIIWEELSPIYLSFPNETEFLQIANDFYQKCGIPNCLGAIDGKHINMVCPPKSGSQYYNYKGRYSLVLLASCDSRYTFTMINIGSYGSQSDGGIFRDSAFGIKLLKNELPIPKEKELPNSNTRFPFYFIGDSAFPLLPNLMRPYAGRNLENRKEHLNTRLSSARIAIETTFGILANRWRILLNNIHANPDRVDTLVKSTVVLHNFLKLNDSKYSPPNYEDRHENNSVIYGQWRESGASLVSVRTARSNRCTNDAFELREKLCNYMIDNN